MGYWRLDESSGSTTVADSSGHGNDGVIQAADQFKFGEQGALTDQDGAMTFQSGGYIEVQSLSSTPVVGSFSVEAWVKPATTSGWLAVLGSRAPSEHTFDFAVGSGNAIGSDYGDGSSWTGWTNQTFTYTAGQWHHVVQVLNAGTWTYYVDGVPIGSGWSGTSAPVLVDSNHYLYLGTTGAGGSFNGSLDEVAVYNYALSADRVRAHYQVGSGVVPPPAPTDAYALQVSQDQPTGYWRLDETSGLVAYDRSGNGNHATFVGTPTLGERGFISGHSVISSDGASRYVHVHPISRPSVSGSFTLEAWINPSTVSQAFMVMGSRGPTDHGFDFGMYYTNPLGLWSDLGDGSNWLFWSQPAYTFSPGQWYQVALVVAAGRVTYYVDGVPIASGTYGGNPLLFDGNHDLFIGTSGTGGSFDGSIAEVAVYDHAVSVTRLAAHYQTGSGVLPPTPPTDAYANQVTTDQPLGYWRLGENTGTIAYDSSGHGNQGNYIGSPTLGAPGVVSGHTVVSSQGASSYIGVRPTSTQTVTGSFTLEAWINPATVSQPFLIMGSRAPSDHGFDFGLYYTNPLGLWSDLGDGNNWLFWSQPGYAFSAGQWYHVALVVASNQVTYYVNGQPIGTGSYGGTPLLFDANHDLFTGTSGVGGTFNGSLGEVAVYDHALSAGRIQAHYGTVWQASLGNPNRQCV